MSFFLGLIHVSFEYLFCIKIQFFLGGVRSARPGNSTNPCPPWRIEISGVLPNKNWGQKTVGSFSKPLG